MQQRTDRRFAISFDLEEGCEGEIELQGDKSLWIAAGAGITSADVWMKDVKEQGMDLRIRIRRDADGIEVLVDRGESGGRWWPTDGEPRLKIKIDPERGIAAASAGAGADEQQVFLGQTAF